MPRTLIRFQQHPNGATQWGVQFGAQLVPLPGNNLTTQAVLTQHGHAIAQARPDQATLRLADVQLRAPITANQQFICQGINYPSHVRESGLTLADLPHNTLFTKAASSITAADAAVVRPAHVVALDYEIELGLVLRRDLPAGTVVAPGSLGQWLAGVTIVNDLSARDVQLPQVQFYKGKSYRGFGPVGPGLVLDDAEWQ